MDAPGPARYRGTPMSERTHGVDFDIAPADPTDLDALARLEERAFDADRIARGQWRHLLTRAHADVLVAKGRDPAVGAPAASKVLGAAVVLYRRGARTARLYSLAVDPDARGRGVARALLARALERAREARCQRMRLEVRADNEVALSLYRARGFAPRETLPDYYGRGVHGIRMELEL